MYMFRRFIGCVCILGCLFCTLATTQLTIFATEIVPVTDTWIPLNDAWDTVAPLYDNYNTALSENSGVTITEDNYKEYVIKSIIGNFVATHEAYGEDVSLDGLVDVIMADADLFNALGSATLVNPLNGAYYLGEAMGASLRSSIDNFLESTFGLTDIMTTSEAVGLDFPYGRVFVKEVASDSSSGYALTFANGSWYCVPAHTTYSIQSGRSITNSSDYDIYFTSFWDSPYVGYYTGNSLVACVYSGASFSVTLPFSMSFSGTCSSSFNGLYGGYYYYRGTSSLSLGDVDSSIHYPYSYSYNDALSDLFGSSLDREPEYTEPIVVINDEDPPIISPTSVYNDWSTISNYYYDTYNTDYVTYNTGDSIYNYTYYYSINNYTNDMPLWVVNGKNLPVYDFDRETFYDFSNTNYTVSDDLVWDSSFFDFVWSYLPVELAVIIITMLVAGAFFLLFKH